MFSVRCWLFDVGMFSAMASGGLGGFVSIGVHSWFRASPFGFPFNHRSTQIHTDKRVPFIATQPANLSLVSVALVQLVPVESQPEQIKCVNRFHLGNSARHRTPESCHLELQGRPCRNYFPGCGKRQARAGTILQLAADLWHVPQLFSNLRETSGTCRNYFPAWKMPVARAATIFQLGKDLWHVPELFYNLENTFGTCHNYFTSCKNIAAEGLMVAG